jgi:UDP-N-acetylenolpyruvoylglucosamine reductase
MKDELYARLQGDLLQPGDEQYNDASKSWNLYAQQRPALIVMATCAEDIVAAVQFAKDNNMGVGVMATGHGVGTRCNDGLLINTSRMRHVTIDPHAQTAKVQAGALWKDVVAAAREHGLAGLAGSASHVGVVGYTLGGGSGYLGRKYGLNSDSITAADIVTADGNLIHISAHEHAELFHGLKGSVGNLGIITSLEFKLYPITNVFGGAVFYPVENAREALNQFVRWSANIPDEITAAFSFVNFPPSPALPEILRGRSVVVIKGCYCGHDLRHGEAIFKPMRKGDAIMDTFQVMPVHEMDSISNDPVDPMGIMQYGCLLSGLSADAIDTLVQIEGAGSGSPLIMAEIRRLGGALYRDNDINLLGTETALYSINAIGATFDPEKLTAHFQLIDNSTRPFQTGQTFINFVEVDPDADRVRSAYTAKDWERLVALKTKYDPTNLFRFNRNIPPQ